VPAGRHRRISFALPRIRSPEDAEAAIDVVMDGLAEGVLSLSEVAEMLRIVERLLEMANTIGEMKHVRDSIARGRSAQAHQEDEPREPISAEDAAEVQAALLSLYSSVNSVFGEVDEPSAAPHGVPAGDANAPPPAGTQRATPEPVAA
jgi:hypothetical protein